MNINKIRLSGTTYNIQDLNATKTVELTQAEYDALPTTAKTSNSLFVITDAQGADLSNYYTKTETDGLLDTKLDVTAYTPTDLSNYYTKSETSGATEISTALNAKADTATTYTKTETDNAITAATSTKQDTLVSGTNIKTINGETLLGEGNITIQGGSGGGKAVSAGTNISITTGETADTINCTLPIETISNPYGVSQIYVGDNIYKNSNYQAIVIANKDDSSTGETRVEFAHGAISIGSSNKVFQNGIVIGENSTAGASNSWNNIAIGYNTVASGTTKTNINNQIKVDDSNQVYIYNKDNTEMICLQDQLGGGGSSYTAGDGIDITNDVISVTGKVDTSAFTAHTADTVIHVTSDEKAAWNAKSDFSGDYNDLANKPTIPTVPTSNTAFTNDAGYITSDAISGKVDTSTYNTYTAATDTALASKQTTLTAGTGISIVDNVISATGGGSGGGGLTEGDELLLSTALTDLNDRKIDASEVKANYQKKGDYATKNYVTTALEPYETKLDEINTEEVTAYALNDLNNKFGGLSLVKITESAYSALTTKDENTLYIVVADPS